VPELDWFIADFAFLDRTSLLFVSIGQKYQYAGPFVIEFLAYTRDVAAQRNARFPPKSARYQHSFR
jgi:hypothetical protein